MSGTGQSVLFVNAVSAVAGGGINDLVHTLPLLRRRLGSNLRVWVSPSGEAALKAAGDTCDGVESLPVRSPLHRAWWELRELPRIVRQQRPAVVLQFSNLCVRKLDVPQVVVLRSMTFFSSQYAAEKRRGLYLAIRYRLGKWLTGRTMANAAAVLCISDTMRQEVAAAFPEHSGKIQTSHLGVDPPQDLPPFGSRAEAVAGLPEPLARRLHESLPAEGGPVLLNISTYYQQKNLLTLLRAAETLGRETPSLRLVLTAGIHEYRGAVGEQEREEIDLARALADRGVLVDLGPIPKSCVWPLLRVADIFVFPSSLESFGHPMLEAMAMGIPVVASDTPIHREIAANAAHYHDTFDPDSLARAVREVLSDDRLRGSMVDDGHRNVTRFSWNRHVDIVLDAAERASGCWVR